MGRTENQKLKLLYLKELFERQSDEEHLLSMQDIPAAELLDPLLMPMDSPASDYPVVNLPLTSSVYFKNGNPVRTSGAPLEGLVRVTEGENGKFIGMGEIDDEGRVAPRRLVVEYPA